jgi:hypothetical protein
MISQIPWIATLGCVVFSTAIAIAFLRNSPRLFTVMALFAFSWALLLPYWAMPIADRALWEIIGVYTGFLTIYIGGLLILHKEAEDSEQASKLAGTSEHGGKKADTSEQASVVWLQKAALRLLIFIVMPSAIVVFSIEQINAFFGMHLDAPMVRRQIELIVGDTLGIVGFVCVVWGVRKIGATYSAVALGVVLLCYAALELLDDWQFWFEPNESLPPACRYCPPPNWYPYLFALMKSLYTLIFGSIVAYHGMPDKERDRGFIHWVTLFFRRLKELIPGVG